MFDLFKNMFKKEEKKEKKEYNKEKGYKTYHHGKDYPKTEKNGSPLKGAPNTFHDRREKTTGKLIQRRKFDSEGKASVDIDMGHPGHNKNIHKHLYNKSLVRSEDKPLSKKEKNEIKKANRKRRTRYEK